MPKPKTSPPRFDADCQVHGANLHQKETGTKYSDPKSRRYLREIRARYDLWVEANVALVGPTGTKARTDRALVDRRVAALVEYKDFIDAQRYAEAFDSRSNLHSSVLEEFIYYLFADLVASFPGAPLIGKSRTFKDLFFFPKSFQEMVQRPYAIVERKDHDFVIGSRVEAKLRCRGSDAEDDIELDVPAVAIECKTYLDKSMLEGGSTAAEQLKARNPNAAYIIVMEWLKLAEGVNLRKFKVDQIYVLRRQQNTDRDQRYDDDYEKNPIDADVVWHLYETVRDHLTAPWGGGVKEGVGARMVDVARRGARRSAR